MEIAVLKAMECSYKSIIPPSLHYKDNVFMYFPDITLIPFIEWTAKSSKLPINNNGVQEHRRNFVQLIIDKV